MSGIRQGQKRDYVRHSKDSRPEPACSVWSGATACCTNFRHACRQARKTINHRGNGLSITLLVIGRLPLLVFCGLRWS